jgi:hypothetical protein
VVSEFDLSSAYDPKESKHVGGFNQPIVLEQMKIFGLSPDVSPLPLFLRKQKIRWRV